MSHLDFKTLINVDVRAQMCIFFHYLSQLQVLNEMWILVLHIFLQESAHSILFQT